jgi:ABC-type polysaccharide/polyol phosphate export permease
MTPTFRKYGQIILALISALAIIGTALIADGTEYENAWLYVFCIWFILFLAFEVYSRKKKDKDQ